MTLLYTDPLFQKHDTGRHHPETARRLSTIVEHLDRSGLTAKCAAGTYKPLTEAQVARVHSAVQIQTVKQMAERDGGHVDNDTPVSSESFQVALAAAGACVAAVDAVIKGPQRNALCLVRPPGHHATPTQSMGFCLFNNIALAANHARTTHQLSRILIVDWDVHHGNGTQDAFFEDPEVAFLSIHRYGQGFYPGTGEAKKPARAKVPGGSSTSRSVSVRPETITLPASVASSKRRQRWSSRNWFSSAPASTLTPRTRSVRLAWRWKTLWR